MSEVLVSAILETGHLQSKDGHRALLLTSGSLIRRVLYYNVYVFCTLPNKIKFITSNTLQKLTITLSPTILYNVL